MQTKENNKETQMPQSEGLEKEGLEKELDETVENTAEEILSEDAAETPTGDENADSTSPEVETEKDTAQEITQTEADLLEMKDKYLRLYSDFENFRRRTAKEKIDFMQQANEGLLQALLPVLDDFERAKTSADDTDAQALKEGFGLIYQKMLQTLATKGLKPMGDLKGNTFDIELHEAVTQIPTPDKDLKGKVVDVIQQGYWLEDKVIRFAKVVVGS